MDLDGLLEHIRGSLGNVPDDSGYVWVRGWYYRQLQKIWGVGSLVMRGQLQLILDWVRIGKISSSLGNLKWVGSKL